MTGGSLTPDERVSAAVRLEKPDRVPVVPLVTAESAAGLAGITQAQINSDTNAALAATLKVFDEVGGWDSLFGGGVSTVAQRQAINMYPMKGLTPGKDIADNDVFQLVEEEVLLPEDYDKICEMGADRFYHEDYLWRIATFTPQEQPKVKEELKAVSRRYRTEFEKRGIGPFHVTAEMHPFFRLSLMRSMVRFTEDLYFNPEPVERALKAITEELISKQVHIAKKSGVARWMFVEERASAFFYPLSVFERFWWPYTEEVVDAFWAEGIVTIFHLDSCWDKNISYFRRLPKGSAIIELDSTTDIFRAKESLSGHLCILGDVPATLLSLGKPEEVEDYCKKLIDEVGGNGGFILSSGCAVPPDCKPENFRAMIETARNYESSRR
ncbi:MAG: uroporphyrinogen decarboxylase family protein [Dehalococcoidia bacterium]